MNLDDKLKAEIEEIQQHISSTAVFGSWVKNIKKLSIDAIPYDHIIIDDFFNAEHAQSFYDEVQKFSAKELWIYENSFEQQRVMNKWDQFGPKIYQSFFELCNYNFERLLSYLFKVNVRADIGLHGGGVVLYPNGGKLNVHLDYETHPKLAAVRNLNILVYLNPNWHSDWGGGLNLYSEKSGALELEKKIECKFNRAVIFNTDQNSWHGLPDKINCPNEQSRTALNFYYVDSSGKVGANDRFRAQFIPSDEQQADAEKINKLSKQRMNKDNPKYD
jgi:Rps23 Pro-64 3,4-dihydroxylase Tpa1-like proline 4-hydroxylase